MSSRLTDKQKKFLEALENSAGIVSTACKKMKISRQTYYNWKKKNEKFAEGVEEIKEGVIDFAESMLLQKIKEGDTTSIIFFLKTKGRHRGYVETKELEVNAKVEIIDDI